MAIDISHFIEIESFKRTTGNILRELRNSMKAPGESRIYTAGEKEYEAWLDRKNRGVPVGEVLQKEMKELQRELNLQQYNFPF